MKPNRNDPRLFVFAFFVCIAVAALAWAATAARPADASARPVKPGVAIPAVTGTPVCGPSWSVVSSPNVTGGDHVLNGVAAVSPTEVWAAGFFTNTDGVAATLIERWDGNQWSIVPSPNVGDVGGNYLQAISASASNNVWAVGYYRLGSALLTLVIHWNGTQLDVVNSPSPSATENYLYGVAAVSANDAWAVGYYNNGTLYRTLTMRWNGSAWNTVGSPNPTLSLGAGLRAVTAVAANDVWAVGAYVNFSTVLQTYIIRWTGSSWSAVTSPNPGSGNNGLIGVSASAANNVWAAGLYNNGTQYLPLVLRWNGSAWSQSPAPGVGAGDNGLSGVVTLSMSDAWAVGAYDDGGRLRTLALHWDGSQWAQDPSENPGSGDNGLFGVGGAVGSLWAVGAYSDGGAGQTLVERYSNVPCATGTPTSTPPGNTPTSTPTTTPTTTATLTATNTPPATSTATSTPQATQTPLGGTSTPTLTATTCPMTFSDVHPQDYFYVPVRYLYCAGIISGYQDGTFRPYNNTTRGQLTKIVVLAEGWMLNCPEPGHFTDVPPSHTFFCYIETAVAHGIISGYADGTFRPGNDVTRGQLCKIVVLAEGWAEWSGAQSCPPPGHFSDVPPGSTFFCYIETAYAHGIISGYADGTFRPGNNATRGQICKIVYSAITQP